MLATLIPLYDSSQEVCAYSLFVQKENKLISTLAPASAAYNGIVQIMGLDVINNVGLDILSSNRDLFLEVNQFSLFSDIEGDCSVDPKHVVFIVDTRIPPTEDILNRIKDLKSKGFRFAIRKLKATQFAAYTPMIVLMDYILLNHKKVDPSRVRETFGKAFPHLKVIAVAVDTKEDYDRLTANNTFDMYEGEFFRLPVKHAGEELAPMKVTYLELIKLVNYPDFDLTTLADVVGHDTALVLQLLAMANRYSVNSEITSIRQAAAMIGQKELRKWITSAVTRELCVDRPSEITRISLVRARFAENLAPLFNMAMLENELFLMGLFSVLDIILNKPMAEAMSMIAVSQQIQEALINKAGPLAPVYTFLLEYEDANWNEVSRRIIVDNLDIDLIYHAYVDALEWFKTMFEINS